MVVLVDCYGEEECIFSIKPKYGHSIHQLVNSKTYHSTITYGSKDSYYFNVQEDVDKVTIILNSLTGDADLMVSKDHIPTLDDYDWASG